MTGADAAAGRGRRAGQRAVAATGRTDVVDVASGAAGAGAAVCAAGAGAAAADAVQQSLVVITGTLATVQPQPVRQVPQASR